TFDSLVSTSSNTPPAKKALSGSGLILAKGSTATPSASVGGGAGAAAAAPVRAFGVVDTGAECSERHITAPPTASSVARISSSAVLVFCSPRSPWYQA